MVMSCMRIPEWQGVKCCATYKPKAWRLRCASTYGISTHGSTSSGVSVTVPYFPHPRQNFAKKALEKKEKDFISSYKFEDKKLGIYKKFLEALKLPQSDEIRLIIQDLMLQMERAVSSSTYPSGRDLLKKMTQLKFLHICHQIICLPTWQEVAY